PGLEAEPHHRAAARDQGHGDERRDRGRLGSAEDGRTRHADRTRPDPDGDDDDVRADDVVEADPAEQERDRCKGDRRADDDGEEQQRADELADDDGERRDRRHREEVERALLALLADRRGGVGRGQDEDDQRLDEDDRGVDVAAHADRLERAQWRLRRAAQADPQQPGEDGQIEGQEDEGALATHPAPDLADPDGRSAGELRWPADGHATRPAASRAVTWRNSSSRSLAARAKLTIGRSARIADASSRAVPASSPRKPISIVPS